MSTIHDLRIESIHQAYANGNETPQSLIMKLREQALAQSDYNAWIYLLDETELQTYLDELTQKPREESPLWGIPFAIKDNIDLEGVATTAACESFSQVAEQSAAVVQALIDAGAIPLGKTNLDQFATGLVGTRSPFGEGKNVFNPDYISGGSSAGSAIATALGQVSFALGTDTAGSGRVPAAFNNLIGHKPSKGLLSTRGVVPACKSLDCVSVFSLTCKDAALLFDVLVNEDAHDPYSRKNRSFNHSAYWHDDKPGSFKFGVPQQLDFDNNSETESLFEQSVTQLQAIGGEKVDIDFDAFLEAARLLYEGPWVAERVWATHDVERKDMLPVIQDILATVDNFQVPDAFAAQYRLQALKKICDQELAKVDFIVTPTTPSCYQRSEITENPIALNSKLGAYTNFMNLLDYAATAVPVGRLSSGVSWGISLFAGAFSDIHLLSFAGALQRHLDLPLGATSHTLSSMPTASRVAPAAQVDVVVCGAHLQGQPLNWQLLDRGASLQQQTQTVAGYGLFALPDGKRPALVQRDNGAAIEVEVWRMPMSEFGSFVAGIPAPLGIGKVALVTGETLPGFICEEGGIANAEDISRFGGWRAYLAARQS